MKYRVVKSSLDGISGGANLFSLDEACKEIYHFKNWNSLEELHASIRKWAKKAKSGEVYTTAVSAIIAVDVIDELNGEECPECQSEEIDYGELSPEEGGRITQTGTCDKCGARWQDEFALVERHQLCKA